MTIWAILSDVHGRGDRLSRVLADAEMCGAGRILSLGDLGGAHILEQLNRAGAQHVFGNWEASGLRGMAQPYRCQVACWPARRFALMGFAPPTQAPSGLMAWWWAMW